jgi:hypothetical protein
MAIRLIADTTQNSTIGTGALAQGFADQVEHPNPVRCHRDGSMINMQSGYDFIKDSEK